MPEESERKIQSGQKSTAGIRQTEKKANGKIDCPNCGREVQLIWVHGHYQCPYCKNVVISCCEGEAE
jgi:C4-type Zn-finger protein